MDSDRHACVRAFVDELSRSGVVHACLCPGSRSTPLALLLRQHPRIRLWTHLDERSAAFFAVGIAKVTGEPAVVVSTSGTAAVNFAPAVVEACRAGVPLLVLTADRPPELRHVGANQTIDQVRLYGPHVRWFVDMALPETSADAVRYARMIACRAAAVARDEATRGPVHVNFPFREPLVPVPSDEHASAREAADRPYVALRGSGVRDVEAAERFARELGALRGRSGLIVCGPQDDPLLAPAVDELARHLQFPILADPLSLVRGGPHHGPLVIDSYDAFLRDVETAAALEPELILQLGTVPVSKSLQRYLARHAGRRHLVVAAGWLARTDRWPDPTLSATEAFDCQPRAFCEALVRALRPAAPADGPPAEPSSAWAQRWIATATAARAAMHRALDETPVLSEPAIFAALGDVLPGDATLFVGNSMPVRDLDTFYPGGSRAVRFLANRGASGIDGVVSTALGGSAVAAGPTVLVIGDLSFYHDMNGLLAVRRHGLDVTIVLVNNDGGGIFSMLPQADGVPHFEELFGTPHGLDFRPAAELYGLGHRLATTRKELVTAVGQSLGTRGGTVVEVKTARAANAHLHRRLWNAVGIAVRSAGIR